MSELHKGFNDINEKVENKEGERELLCSNKVNVRSPSLHYEFISSPECLNRAFDILFEEVLRRKKNDN